MRVAVRTRRRARLLVATLISVCIVTLGLAAVSASGSSADTASADIERLLKLPRDRYPTAIRMSPLGTTIVASTKQEGAAEAYLAGYRPDGELLFDRRFEGQIDDVTFSPTGETYILTAARNNEYPNEVALHRLDPTGALLGSVAVESAETYLHSMEYVAEGDKLYIATHPAMDTIVVSLDADLQGKPTVLLQDNETGQLIARPGGIVYRGYRTNTLIRSDGSTREYPVVTGADGHYDILMTSVSPDATIWDLLLRYDGLRGAYACDLSSISRRGTDGSSAFWPATNYFGDATTCRLQDVSALPDGGAVVSATVGQSLELRWINDSGSLLSLIHI